MNTQPKGLVGTILHYVSGLRFPWLLGLVAALLAVDIILPDMLPFADELLLGATTLLLAAWRKRKDTIASAPPDRFSKALPAPPAENAANGADAADGARAIAQPPAD